MGTQAKIIGKSLIQHPRNTGLNENGKGSIKIQNVPRENRFFFHVSSFLKCTIFHCDVMKHSMSDHETDIPILVRGNIFSVSVLQ